MDGGHVLLGLLRSRADMDVEAMAATATMIVQSNAAGRRGQRFFLRRKSRRSGGGPRLGPGSAGRSSGTGSAGAGSAGGAAASTGGAP
jgi:hypothetical protein